MKDSPGSFILRTPVLAALLAALLFGAATPFSKYLLQGFSPFQLAGLLYFGAALGVLPWVSRRGGSRLKLPNGSRNRWRLLGAIVFGGILGPVALLFGLRLADAASVSLWLNLELVATALLGVLLFRDQLGARSWFGIALALVASTLLIWGPGIVSISAGALILLACVCWGLDNHFTALIDNITPAQSTLWKASIAGAVNLAIGTSLDPVSANLQLIIVALLVGAFCYGASIVLYIHAAQSMGATRAQAIFASAPFFGVALTMLFLEQDITLMILLSAILFVIAIPLMLGERHGHRHRHEVLSHRHSHSHADGHHNHEHEGDDTAKLHSHLHSHEAELHNHAHLPDLHHRHRHPHQDDLD